jgi:hypothetical protein
VVTFIRKKKDFFCTYMWSTIYYSTEGDGLV